MKDKRVKIISDGSPAGTQVFDENGVQIKGCITRVLWGVKPGAPAVAVITFANVELDVTGELSDDKEDETEFSDEDLNG